MDVLPKFLGLFIIAFLLVETGHAWAETTVILPQKQSPNAARPPMSPLETLSPSDQSTAVKMSGVYSRHLYNTHCFEVNKGQLTSKGVNKKPAKTSEQLQKSCDCMADYMLSKHDPYELSTYITKNHGVSAPKPPPKSKAPKAVLSDADMKMAVDWRDPAARKKCGINAQ